MGSPVSRHLAVVAGNHKAEAGNVMAGFDDAGVFFSDNFGSEDQTDDPDRVNRQQIKNRLRDFIRQFHEGNFSYRYR